MIIINQKNQVVNYDNVIKMYVNCTEIGIETTDGNYDTLGEYKTKERANSILNEIIDTYRFNRCESVLQKNVVYKMPEK